MTDSTPRWYCRVLGDATLAAPLLDELCAAFAAAVAAGECGGGLFLRHESEGQLHCSVKVYFSPGAAAVAPRLGARPCLTPGKDGLSLLAGDAGAWAAEENDL